MALNSKTSTKQGATEKRGNIETRVLDDFRYFLAYVWHELGLPRPTKRQLEIADFLQDTRSQWKVIEAFRGIGKSWETAAFAAWKLLKNQDEKIIILSGAGNRAYDFSTFLLRMFNDIPLLQPLKPTDEQRGSVRGFDVNGSKLSQSPSVRSIGIFGQKTGSRASIVIYDDIETTENALTEEARERLLRSSNEALSLLFPETDDMKPMIIYLGTPQTQESIYNRRMSSGAYETRIWPALFPENVDIYVNKETGKNMLAPSLLKELEEGTAKPGDPTDPQRFDAEELAKRRASMSDSEFKMQFQLDTSASDETLYPLKTKDLIVVEGLNDDKGPVEVVYGGQVLNCFPNVGFTGDRLRRAQLIGLQREPWESTVLAIDPSGRGTDETSYAIVSALAGRLFIRASGGFLDGYSDETLEHIASKAKEYNVNAVIVEANFGDGMFTRLLTPVILRTHKCAVEEVKHSKQKELRIIDTLKPLCERHRLVVDMMVIEKDLEVFAERPAYSMLYQLTRITAAKRALRHDDRLDALSIAIGFFVEAMSRDEDKATNEYKDKIIDREIQRIKQSRTVQYKAYNEYMDTQLRCRPQKIKGIRERPGLRR